MDLLDDSAFFLNEIQENKQTLQQYCSVVERVVAHSKDEWGFLTHYEENILHSVPHTETCSDA